MSTIDPRPTSIDDCVSAWQEAIGSPLNWDRLEAALRLREEFLPHTAKREVLRLPSPKDLGHLASAYPALWRAIVDRGPWAAWETIQRIAGEIRTSHPDRDMRYALDRPGNLFCGPDLMQVLRSRIIRGGREPGSMSLFRLRQDSPRLTRQIPLGGQTGILWTADQMQELREGSAHHVLGGHIGHLWTVDEMARIDCLRMMQGAPERMRTATLLEATRHGLGMILDLDHYVVAAPFPKVFRDALGRLHSESGPAVAWADGDEDFFLDGVRVPRIAVTAPDRLTPKMIFNERNTETRRILAERYGIEKLLSHCGRTLVHSDSKGRLWDISWDVLNSRPGPIRMVEVVCPTTGRKYFLRVPRNIRKAASAVAWTFGMRVGEYTPAIET